MASIPGFRFDITGASGSQGLLTPKASWRAYIFPRGAYAAQDSAGSLITVDSAAAANRFTALDWVQVGTNVANIRQVNVVGGNSFSISGAVLTVTENDRVYLIGTTQPTVTGGSATYTVPNTIIYQRDDTTGTTYANSMITSDSNGMVQGFAVTSIYDIMIQDSDGTNQGSIIDMVVGSADLVQLFTWATRPTADASWIGRIILVRTASGPSSAQMAMQKPDDTYEWVEIGAGAAW